MILLISELLSARGAVVSPGEGVTNALAAEQVATFGGDHEPAALDDLEEIKKRSFRGEAQVSAGFELNVQTETEVLETLPVSHTL